MYRALAMLLSVRGGRFSVWRVPDLLRSGPNAPNHNLGNRDWTHAP